MAVSNVGMRARSARADSGPSIIVTTKADATGSSTGRARLSEAMSAITKIPTVAACDAVRQTCATSSTGSASRIVSGALRREPPEVGFWFMVLEISYYEMGRSI